MKEALREINALQEAGIIGQSAIGGAMGATFYLEARLEDILERHGLVDAWAKFEARYLP